MFDVNESNRLTINLATAGDILTWSNGEVKKPETINYRTLKPEKDGLFCEDLRSDQGLGSATAAGNTSGCGFKGIICERCGVEVTRFPGAPQAHGPHPAGRAPSPTSGTSRVCQSRLGYLLDIAPKSLEKVIYFAAHLVTWIDTERLHKDLPSLEAEMKAEMGDIEREREVKLRERDETYIAELEELEGRGAKKNELERAEKAKNKDFEEIRLRYDEELAQLKLVWDSLRTMKPKQLVDDERVWRELVDRYHDYFAGGMGAESVKDLVSRLDLAEVEAELKETIATAKGQRKAKAIKRLKVISAFNRRDDDGKINNSADGHDPRRHPGHPARPAPDGAARRWPVRDLRPQRPLPPRDQPQQPAEAAPRPRCARDHHQQREADAPGGRRRAVRQRPPRAGHRPRQPRAQVALRHVEGQAGPVPSEPARQARRLLGSFGDRRRSAAALHQCGLPKQMALELFKPFVMKRLVDLEYAQNIKSAKRMVERARPQVWDVLEEVIKEHPVFLNRAPTLHRLGIQAFEPVLVEGKAIQIHPLVCAAFNADFDGDQMAVHLPLSAEAQAEARLLMLSAHNILSPASGRPIAVPSQDMIIGVYYMTEQVDGGAGTGRVFASLDEAVAAYEERYSAEGETVSLHTKIKVRVPASKFPVDRFPRPTVDDTGDGAVGTPTSGVLREYGNNGTSAVLYESSLGRFLLNTAFPDDFPFVDRPMRKRDITEVVSELVVLYDKAVVADSLDKLKALGYEWSTRAGLTISISDVTTPPAKAGLLEQFEGEAAKVESQYDRGIITDDERRQQEIEIWTDATNQVTKAMQDLLQSTKFNPIDMMVGSGARGNVMQVRQIAGMRGLVANPRGEIIPRPIKSNFREGLSVLEYFISTHGARKGLADTALRTADSGYLTRRLVDVAQELIVREIACDTVRGIWVEDVLPGPESWRLLETSLLGRCLAEDLTLADGTVIPRNTEVNDDWMHLIADDPNITRVRVRSVLTCETVSGVCSCCYGRMLATGKIADLGEAIGIVAAQSIGEPGTQLTMRTFHTGGVAGEDITHGLPRVVELFEARTPKSASLMADVSGVIRLGENEKGERVITVVADDGIESRVRSKISRRSAPRCARRTGRAGRRPFGRRREEPARPEEAARDQGCARDPAVPR